MNGREILTTAVEGGIGYWSYASHIKRDADDWITSVHLTPSVDPEDFTPITVSCGQMKAAEADLIGKYPKGLVAQYAAKDDHDAGTADSIVQTAVFGRIIFG